MSRPRPDRLVDLLPERELDALLVTNLVNVRYLTGFTGTNGLCVVAGEQRTFLTDFRYLEQAEAEVTGFEQADGRQDLLEEVAKRLGGRVGFDDDHLSVRAHARLRDAVGEGVTLVPARGLVEQLRMVKEPEELAVMREAAALADGIYEYVRERGLVGRLERDVAVDLEREMRERGADGPAFPSIVAGGPHGARPHAAPRREPIEPDSLVILDLGCLVEGYCSDCTRTFATGDPGGEASEVYELVLAAQRRALAAVRAGAAARDVDAAARELIVDAGHGEHFGHGVGHGVGLLVHEEPRLSKASDHLLGPGNVVTVEPGVYLPGRFGVRIEDLVVVTDGEPEVLSGFTKEVVAVED